MRQAYGHCFTLTYPGREQLIHILRQLFRPPNRTTQHRRLQPRRKGVATRRKEAVDKTQTFQKRKSIHRITRMVTLRRLSLQRGCSKRCPARPHQKKAPKAYPLGYVEEAFEVRTPLDGVFSSRQNKKYRCAIGRIAMGLQVKMSPSAFTTYVSGFTSMRGKVSFSFISRLPMLRHFFTATTRFSKPSDLYTS